MCSRSGLAENLLTYLCNDMVRVWLCLGFLCYEGRARKTGALLSAWVRPLMKTNQLVTAVSTATDTFRLAFVRLEFSSDFRGPGTPLRQLTFTPLISFSLQPLHPFNFSAHAFLLCFPSFFFFLFVSFYFLFPPLDEWASRLFRTRSLCRIIEWFSDLYVVK